MAELQIGVNSNVKSSEPALGIVVIGMHRSGTSALTGSLAEAGAYLGNVLGHSIAHNRKGLQEPASLVYMHENLLQSNGGSWDNPPVKVQWGKLHAAVRDLFLESRHGRRPWAFKDPRTLLVLDGWLEACPDLSPAGIFRHPALVAHSLQKRNGFSFLKGLGLWQLYNQQLLEWTKRLDVPLVEFSSDPLEMRSRLAAIRARMKLSSDQPVSFYDASLPAQFPLQVNKLPDEVERLYAQLKELALDQRL
jgi:hypothetical protein